ncbi:MAG: pilin [Candidatus Peregrinibacteria bacterium]|nr:pilin [Candidatus Peregrinibacteria bacterium]
MKRLATLLLIIFSAITLLLPGMAFAQGKGGSSLTPAEQNAITNQVGAAGTDLLPTILRNAGLCLTNDEKTNYITTVLETPIDSPEDRAAFDANNGVIVNADQTITKRCYRFTQILALKASGNDKQQSTDQYLIKACPSENDIPEGYGLQSTGDYYDCQEVTVIMSPLEQGGIGVLNVYVSLIYRWVAGIVGIVAVLIMIISGLQIITAQGESEAVSAGKKRIMQAIGGIVLLFFASGILYMINPTFFNPPTYPAAATSTPTPAAVPTTAAPTTTPKEMTTPPPTSSEVPVGAPQQVKIDAMPPAN